MDALSKEDNFIGSQPIVHGAEIVIDVIQPGPDSDSLSSSKTEDRRSKRILHFSDGTLEESSSDEEVMHELPVDSPLVNPKSLMWIPWTLHYASVFGEKALSTCDRIGESLASFLGITGPKYRYEIEEAERIRQEEVMEKQTLDLEMSGWKAVTDEQENKVSAPQTRSPVSCLDQQ